MGLLNFFTNPTQAVQDVATDVTSNVTKAGGNFFMDILTSPFKAIAGFGRGVFGSLWNVAKYTGIVAGIQILAPNLWVAGVKAIGGQAAVDARAAHIAKDGIPGILLDSLKLGGGTAAAIGGVSGALDNVGGGIIAKGTAAIVMASVGAVAIGALHKDGLQVASNDGAGTLPPATPGARPKAEQAKG